LKDGITVALAGLASEKLIYNEVSSGTQDDLKRATAIARRMVTDLGMSEKLGPRTFGDKQELIFLGSEISEQKNYSEKTAGIIDSEIDAIIRNCYEISVKILTENREKLVEVAQSLINRETLDFDELEAIFRGEQLPPKLVETKSPETKQPEAKTPQPAPGVLLPVPN